MADIQALRASKNQAKSNTDWPRFSLFFDKVLLISKQNNFQKKFFSATGARNVAGKSIRKIWNLEKIWISGDNILWCSVDHILLLWFLCSGHGSVMKKKKEHVISLAPIEIMPQNHRKCDFLAFSYWNLHWYPKDHIAERKYSENPPLVLFFFTNTMFQRQYDLVPKWQNFFKCTNMFFQVCIFEIKSDFYVIPC